MFKQSTNSLVARKIGDLFLGQTRYGFTNEFWEGTNMDQYLLYKLERHYDKGTRAIL